MNAELFFDPQNDAGSGAIQKSSDAEEIFQILDRKIDQAIQDHDIQIIIEEIAILNRGIKIVGMGLVRLLGRINENWDIFGINEPIVDYLYAETGLNPATVERYIRVYQMLQHAPEDLRPRIQSMNVKNLIPIGNMIAQGWSLERADWEELAQAHDYNEVAQAVRELKGQKPRKSGLRLWCNRSGELYAFKSTEDGVDERHFVTSLPVNDPDPVIRQAVERLLKNAGVSLE